MTVRYNESYAQYQTREWYKCASLQWAFVI